MAKELDPNEKIKQDAIAEYRQKSTSRAALRDSLTQLIMGKQGEGDDEGLVTGNELYRRAVEDLEDPFTDYYNSKQLKEPPYNFQRLWSIYEESDILQACVDAYQKNTDSFGYNLLFLGDDIKEKDKPENKRQLTKAKNFFDRVNEEESFATIRQLMRQDLEVMGNGAFEVIRDLKGEVAVMYYLPFKYIRMSSKNVTPIVKEVSIMRDGKMVKLKIRKTYRKFAQLRSDGKRLRWFKEFGDPRVMDALTGDYAAKGATVKYPASEIWHFKIPFGGLSYGMPRWIGAMLSVLGRRLAEFVNYDLFENQGIPPMALMITGGTLTDESMKTLKAMLRGLRGAENFNRMWLLEALPEGMGLEDTGNVKMELKNLADQRKEDQMFSAYLDGTEKAIRRRFRIPPLYTGGVETFTLATAKAAQTVVEEQVFVPERLAFDEPINTKLLPELKIDQFWYKTKGPRMVGAADITTAIKAFSDTGALSVNHAIERANEAFGLEMSIMDAPWADYPISFVVELIRAGEIRTVDLIEGMKITPPPAPPAPKIVQAPAAPAKALPPAKPKQPKLLPAPAVKAEILERVMKSEDFTSQEKAILKVFISLEEKLERL